MPQDLTAFAPYRVICEGRADEVFVKRLLWARWGVSHFDISNCGGISGLPQALLALDAVISTNPGRLRGIIILFDSDDDPGERFDKIIEYIRSTKLKYPMPSRPLEIKRGNPAVAVGLIPWIDAGGNLESLVFEALQTSHADMLVPLDQFCEATKHRNGDWTVSKKAKMRLSCLIAGSFQPDPSTALSHFLETAKCPVDFYNSAFDRIVQFLEEFHRTV